MSDEQSVGKIQLASDLSLLHRVESLVGEATAGTGLDHASTADIVTAVSEIVINAMVHGNRLDHDLHVDIETFADTDQVKVVVQDEGEGFDPGAVSDPTGGIGDLRTGTVRFVGDPAQRIGEDTLRVLRYFRFHAWYGKPPVDEASYAACRAAAGDLGNLSAERVAGEALRLLAAPEPLEAVRLMAEAGVLKAVAPEARDLDSFARLLELEESIDPLLRLGVLIADGDGPGRAAALAARLRFSNADSARLKLMMEAALTVAGGVNERAARTLIYAFGNAAFEDGVQVARARAGVGEKFEPLIDLSRSWPAPTLPVRGADARALGIDKGPRVGEALRALETWWVENDFAPTREACLEKLRGLV